MCLAVPARIIELESEHAVVDMMGITKTINIQLIEQPMNQDYVLVHAGFAIQKIDKEYFDFLVDAFQKMLKEIPEQNGQ